jgi:hypothetical protein
MPFRRKHGHSPTGLQIGQSADKLSFFGATPIVRTAAYSITNRTSDRAIDCNSTTDDEMADVVGTLIKDLISLGIFQGTVVDA